MWGLTVTELRLPAYLRFLQGDESRETLDAVREEAKGWLFQPECDRPIGLHRFHGLGGPRVTRRMMRDRVLAEIVAMFPGMSAWQRACLLAEEARSLQKLKAGQWREHSSPPKEASSIQAGLLEAMRFDELPESAEGWLNHTKQDALDA